MVMPCVDPDGSHSENYKKVRFLSNTGPDVLKNHKATKPAFKVGPYSDIWILSSTKTSVVNIGISMTKLSGSAHEPFLIKNVILTFFIPGHFKVSCGDYVNTKYRV